MTFVPFPFSRVFSSNQDRNHVRTTAVIFCFWSTFSIVSTDFDSLTTVPFIFDNSLIYFNLTIFTTGKCTKFCNVTVGRITNNTAMNVSRLWRTVEITFYDHCNFLFLSPILFIIYYCVTQMAYTVSGFLLFESTNRKTTLSFTFELLIVYLFAVPVFQCFQHGTKY